MADHLSTTTTLPRRPEPPEGMPAAARRTWAAIVGDFRPGHFNAANQLILAQLCEAAALVQSCNRRIAKDGLLLRGKVNPLLAVRAAAWSEVRACATKLRISISGTVRAEHAAARPDPNAGLRKPWERSA